MSVPVIETKHLTKYFKTQKGTLHAVEDVNITINQGETIGVVGESGCGKTTLGRVITRLEEATKGEVYLEGREILKLKGKEKKKIYHDIQMVFQDPYSSLNPRLSVGDIIADPLLTMGKKMSKKERGEQVREIMEKVGLPSRYYNQYPHELDGGRRQRVGLARALALNPKFIVCDEPVSALDVSIQAQVLNLLQDLQAKSGVTYMFVTHDLSVVKHISDYICVMYLGQLVETTTSRELFAHPVHPYTKALLSAIPSVDIHHKRERILLQGEIVSPVEPKPGCRFAARCPYATKQCQEPQQLREIGKEHFVSCCRAEEIGG